MIHTFVIWLTSSQNQFASELVRPLVFSCGLVCHILLFVYFFQLLIPDIGFLDKCHTSVFNALIWLQSQYSYAGSIWSPTILKNIYYLYIFLSNSLKFESKTTFVWPSQSEVVLLSLASQFRTIWRTSPRTFLTWEWLVNTDPVSARRRKGYSGYKS